MQKVRFSTISKLRDDFLKINLYIASQKCCYDLFF